MSPDLSVTSPYVDWTLDRWKVSVILLLFVGLLFTALRPQPTAATPSLVVAAPSGSAPRSQAAESTTPTLVPAPAQATPTPRLPLTLAKLGPNAVLPVNSVRVLFGAAAPGAQVEVRDQPISQVERGALSTGVRAEEVLGVVTADADGLWQLPLSAPLEPGQHVLTLRELDRQGQLVEVSAPRVVTILAPGEEGPLALVAPMMESPLFGSRVQAGAVTFVGSGLPGLLVRLYLNDEPVGEGVVSVEAQWQVTPAEPLAAGVYTARAVAVNPQGDILAESAPVAFRVEAAPAQSSLPFQLPTPSLPLTVSGLAFGDRRRTTLVVRGFATPQIGVVAWLGGRPVQGVNAAMDGRWQLAIQTAEGFPPASLLTVRSSLGEEVRTDLQRQRPLVQGAPLSPTLLSPHAGEVLTTPRPRLEGVAQPASDVVILVNRQVVSQVRADGQGRWSYQVTDPLPVGLVTLAAGVATLAQPERLAAPVVVTVAETEVETEAETEVASQ